MLKIFSRCRLIFSCEQLIRANYCINKRPPIPREYRELQRDSIPSIGVPMREMWEPGVGPVVPTALPSKKDIREARTEFKKGCCEWVEEIKEGWRHDPEVFAEHGAIHKKWTFVKEDSLKDFAYTNDSEEEFGYSTCTVTRSSYGTLLFKGNLSTSLRDDGVAVRSGFCGFRTPRATKSFNRKSFYNWGMYTHVVLKVRGDGRYYLINLGQDDDYDHTWYDLQSYFLFTKGGPYWQTVKIPFSKFIHTHKGKIQDQQPELEPTKITFLGITLCDDVNGPFQLEIEYIGTMFDASHTEETAYETYDITTAPFKLN